ncbi:MAG: hypothetical protein IRY94_16355 [Rhodospirillaceae bacterium]|nr:hypothetical protein [Rhodospirillaceae bacterium]
MRPPALIAFALLLLPVPARSAGPLPEQVSATVKPGPVVEVAVIDRQPVRGVALVTPDGRTLTPISTRHDPVIPYFGPTGRYFDVPPSGPDYRYNPFRGEYGSDPRCNPEFGINRLFSRQGLVMPPLGCPAEQRHRYTFGRTVARFPMDDIAAVQQNWPQWRLRIAHADGRALDLGPPPLTGAR